MTTGILGAWGPHFVSLRELQGHAIRGLPTAAPACPPTPGGEAEGAKVGSSQTILSKSVENCASVSRQLNILQTVASPHRAAPRLLTTGAAGSALRQPSLHAEFLVHLRNIFMVKPHG